MATVIHRNKPRDDLSRGIKHCLFTLTFTLDLLRVAPAAEPLVIENACYRVEVDPVNGALIGLVDKTGGLRLIQEPRLADNFRFTLPLRGPTAWQSTEANLILGRDQQLTNHDMSTGRLMLRWNGPLTSTLGQQYDVSAGMTIQFVDDSASVAEPEPRVNNAIHFDFWIDNRTPLEIGEVFAPILGGIRGVGESADELPSTELILPTGTGRQSHSVFHTFSNMSWLGIHGPEQYYSYPDVLSMPWLDLYQPGRRRAFYVGLHDDVLRYKLLHLELSPGVSGPRPQGNWPSARERRTSGGRQVIRSLHAVSARAPTVRGIHGRSGGSQGKLEYRSRHLWPLVPTQVLDGDASYIVDGQHHGIVRMSPCAFSRPSRSGATMR